MKTMRFLILGLLATTTLISRAQNTSPGWFQVQLPPSSVQANTFSTSYVHANGTPVGTDEPSSPVAEAITPQIQALADGLQDNPQRIFDYVHDHIKFVLYFGSKKGANLTLLEKSGNDFDQAALLVALLSAAGYSNSVNYQFGWMLMPYDDPYGNNYDLHHWWQLTLNNTNFSTTINYVVSLAGTRGYPTVYGQNVVNLYYDTVNPIDGYYTNNFLIQRIWVNLTVGSTNYVLDPAFKVSEPITTLSGFSLTNAMGSGTISNDLLTAAGGTDTGNYAQSLNESAVRNKLTAYTTNLLNYIASNAPNSSVQQVLGGWQIVPANNAVDFSTSLPFTTATVGDMPILTWTYEPTNLMSTLNVAFAGTSTNWFMPQLQGDRLSLVFGNTGMAQLWQDDNLVTQAATSGSGSTNVVLSVTHPVGYWDTVNNVFIANPASPIDQTTTNTYQCTNATYALVYAFEPDWGWLQQRENVLDTYLQEGYTNGSRQVTSETLNVMGLNWMLQTEQSGQMLASQLGVSQQYFHRIGRMAQESGHGYYVDVYMQFTGEFPSGGNDAAHLQAGNTYFDLWSFFASSLEHGLIEQLQNTNLVGASTIKMLEIANTNGQAVYLASSTNWATGYGVEGHLTTGTYSSTVLSTITGLINAGYYILLPQNGSNSVTTAANSWAGYGYESLLTSNGLSELQMKIGGGYDGGYSSDPDVPIDPPYVDTTADDQSDYYTSVPISTPNPTSADPLDTADGTYQVENADLSLGQAAPRGISFGRYYNGTRRFSSVGGMTGGWIHNYCITANNVAAPEACMGGTTPAQAASMFTATAAAIAMYNGGYPDPKNWLTAALVAKWSIDQVTKSGVSVNLGQNTLQFVQQPNGVFIPPANCTSILTESNSAYVLQMRHGNQFKFNASGNLTNITDQYSQSMSLTYNASNWVNTITDWKSRTLTFTYSGTPSQLTSVSDGTRTVSYGYSDAYNPQGDLVSFTDPEGKTSTYQYDTNHQIIAAIDAASRLIVSNIYDSQGHVKTQLMAGNTNQTWSIFWSGWQTTEFDPASDESDYLYDDEGRLVGQRDAFGNLSQIFYDGQNHTVMTVSPLNETNQFIFDGNNNLTETIDPLGFTNQSVYDNNNDLIKQIDQRGNVSTFGYNTEFSLTGQTNGAGDYLNYIFNSSGTLASRTDSGGTATYGYDSYGQLSSVIYPNSLGTNSFVNNKFGDVTTNTNPRGFATVFQYNDRRQLTNSIAPTNLVSRITYDSIGNQSTVIDARGNVASNTWSVMRQLLTTALPSTPEGTPIVTSIYDNRNWLSSTVDPLQHSTFYSKDADERLIAATDPLSRTTTYSYDADSQEVATTNAAGEITSQTWNARGELLQLTDGAGHTSQRAYDGAGNQIILTNRNGNAWQFYFDGANRLTNIISPKGYSTSTVFNHQGLVASITDPLGQTTIRNYDGKGRLTNRTDLVATTLYHYDANDNLTNVIENNNTNSWTFDAYNRASSYKDVYGNLIRYQYDANGNLTNLIYPGGHNVYYAYDNLNRMTNVTDWAGRKTSIGYDLDGHVTSIVRPNGTYRTIAYDAAGEATNILEQNALGFPIALICYNWNAAAEIQSEFIAPLPATNALPTRTMTYDADNRLATVDGNSVSLDNSGNLLSGPLTNDTFATYVYDKRNRLLNAAGITNGYDALNNRIGQTYGTNVSIFVMNPVASLPQMLMRIKNGVTNYYVYGPGLLYQVTETPAATNTLTYHYDYRGSTIALTADNGNVTDRMGYSLYATMNYRIGTNDTPFLFNGQYGIQSDPNGLLYMRARYYNPFLCRFLNPDPSGFSGGMNFFTYANGNPANNTDPTGLDATGGNQGLDMSGLNWPNSSSSPNPISTATTSTATPSDLSNPYSLSGQDLNALPEPCIVCHGMSGGGYYNGEPNSFSGLTAIPGSGPNAMQGYSTLESLSVAVAPLVAGPVGGAIGESLDAGVVAGSGTVAPTITVIGSGADVAPYVGRAGYNTFTGVGIAPANLDSENALWLNAAIQNGDTIMQVTDPAVHQALMNSLGLQSSYLNLEIPMLNEYENVNVILNY
jgi:RHS repeat-associated protein